jgi:nucleotide-binding universal stress UspA family protein
MPKILMPVDTSDSARRAVQHAASMARGNPTLQLHLLNVQEPLEPRVHAQLTHDEIKALQAQDAERVLEPLRQLLGEAGVPYSEDWRAGPIAPTIADYAREINCESIVMGTRGMNAIGNLVMGSTATKVIHLTHVPVTLVK